MPSENTNLYLLPKLRLLKRFQISILLTTAIATAILFIVAILLSRAIRQIALIIGTLYNIGFLALPSIKQW